MLLSIDYAIEKTLILDLFFEDGENKKARINVGDVVSVAYNNGRLRKTVTGKVTRIEAGTHYTHNPNHVCQQTIIDTCDKDRWFIIVDASLYSDSATTRIEVAKILDIDVLSKAESTNAITTPSGLNAVTQLRLLGRVLQLSVNNGQSWMNVVKLPAVDLEVDKELQDTADSIAELIPKCINPEDKAELVKAILDEMQKAGQIVINKGCECDCCTPEKPEPEPEPPVEETKPGCGCGSKVPSTEEITEATIKKLIEMGIIGNTTSPTTPSPDEGETTEPEGSGTEE